MRATPQVRGVAPREVSTGAQAPQHLILVVSFPWLDRNLRQTNGKKKLNGSLALMVGRALKPATAGADTSTKVTAVERRTVLSFPELVCNKKSDASPAFRRAIRRTKMGHLAFSSTHDHGHCGS